jgi:indole-3-glycerol phosphate synthase
MGATILDRIVARKREEVSARRRRRPLVELQQSLGQVSPVRGFAAALDERVRHGRAAVIAEIKKASPSKGVIRADFQPAAIARSYEAGGAACL